MTGSSLIVGSEADLHVQAVIEVCQESGTRPVLIDAESLGTSSWELRGPSLKLRMNERQIGGAGWLRRLAPPESHSGLTIGSQKAAEAASRLALLVALSSAPIDWLTDYWTLMRAENKLIQYRAAACVDVPVPQFEVVSSPESISASLGDQFVVKPLGTGEYRTESDTFAVHSNVIDRSDQRLYGLVEAPFLIQRLVEATRHLRVVTVGDQAWSAALDAEGVPVDWRLDLRAHESWLPVQEPAVERKALNLSRALGLGFTSQDWIVDLEGEAWFIDGNPAGQWLFLPPEVCDPVTAALALWLTTGSE
jgi:hypothetical protein